MRWSLSTVLAAFLIVLWFQGCDRQLSKWDKLKVTPGQHPNDGASPESPMPGPTPAPTPGPTPTPTPGPGPTPTLPAPTLDAGVDVSAIATLTRTATVTTPGTSGTYLWEKISGPGTVNFTAATSATTNISATADGTYEIKCTYTRGDDAVVVSDSFQLLWDTTPPPDHLSAFTATPTTHFGTIDLQLDLPPVTTDIASITLRRKLGTTAPSDCTDGSTIQVWTSPYADPINYTDFTNAAGSTFSYRVCLTDSLGNNLSGVAEEQTNKTTKKQPVFVSSTPTVGLIGTGGLVEADAFCTDLAANPSVPEQAIKDETIWLAMLSSSTIHVKDRVRIAGTLEMPGVGDVSSSRANFWAGSATAAIDTDELGGLQVAEVWTGSTSAGVASGSNCNNWTSSSAGVTGTYGNLLSPYGTDDWQAGTDTCDQANLLYCIAQPPAFSVTFNATTAAGQSGTINLAMTYPGNFRLAHQTKIQRLTGATAPDYDCSNGTNVYTAATPSGTTVNTTDATATPAGGTFSYRICVTDSYGNTLSSQAVTNVASGP